VVPNAANPDVFRPEPASSEIPLTRYVVFVGALSPWQGIDTLLEAVADEEWPSDTKLVFVGDGVERPNVEAAAAKNRKVLYLGRRPQKSIPGIISGSIAGLSTQNRKRGASSEYGFSAIKVFEIMACGRPAIVTDFPGQGDVVRNANAGIVTAPESPKAIAKAVATLRSHPEVADRLGRNGREAIEQEHTWQHRANTTSSILNSVLSRRDRKHAQHAHRSA
jgi:glycosyltransferase involved in cell wall biosynthesis